ncbi:hypothetical protein [Streptomyces sp. NRRL F-5126]|uniref:hypothetical protein n=1 Tax=Streptomyces sp. NRRL F-5126 TaxID=1463857 RepID=UPI000A6A6F4A|nr:hypothetical protein [Streptomyces sp. NRRL F-5126]
MTLFRLDASILPAASASAEIADVVEAKWTAAHPGEKVVRRHLGTDPLPAHIWASATVAGFTPEPERTSTQREVLADAQDLVEELVARMSSSWPCRSTTSASPSTSRRGSTW